MAKKSKKSFKQKALHFIENDLKSLDHTIILEQPQNMQEFKALQEKLDKDSNIISIIHDPVSIELSGKLCSMNDQISNQNTIIIKASDQFITVCVPNKSAFHNGLDFTEFITDCIQSIHLWRHKIVLTKTKDECIVCMSDSNNNYYRCAQCMSKTCIVCLSKIAYQNKTVFICPNCRDEECITVCQKFMPVEICTETREARADATPRFTDVWSALKSVVNGFEDKDDLAIIVQTATNYIIINIFMDDNGDIVFKGKYKKHVVKELHKCGTMFAVGFLPTRCDCEDGGCGKIDFGSLGDQLARGFLIDDDHKIYEIDNGFEVMVLSSM